MTTDTRMAVNKSEDWVGWVDAGRKGERKLGKNGGGGRLGIYKSRNCKN
jgi:hypothetical protein